MVEAAGGRARGARGAAQGEVPLEEGLSSSGSGVVVGRRVRGELRGFFDWLVVSGADGGDGRRTDAANRGTLGG